MDALLNVSNTHLFWQGRPPMPLEGIHRSSFLAFPSDPAEDIASAHARLVRLVAAAQATDDPLAKVAEVGQPIPYKSFWNHGAVRPVIPVATRRSFSIPEVSDRLFFEHGFYTAEHDITGPERALADLAAEKDWWLLDTRGQPRKLTTMVYDIEQSTYRTGLTGKSGSLPIDVIGYASFDVGYHAAKDLETEQFDFEITHLDQSWRDIEVTQLVARNADEEMDNLLAFTQHAVTQDIIAGHNVLSFDNKQVHDRIQGFLAADLRRQSLSPAMKEWFTTFTSTYSRPDRSFHFGTSQEIAVWHPLSLDTFLASRRFYGIGGHDDFSAKGMAQFLLKDLRPDDVGASFDAVLDMHAKDMAQAATHGPRPSGGAPAAEGHEALLRKVARYNVWDVREQVGITQILVAQALPLAFTVNLPFDDLFGGNTKLWDHMALIRARRQRKIMPATCRAGAIAKAVQRAVPTPFPSREAVAAAARAIPQAERAALKEFIRVAKQGPEMPFWVEHPGVIARSAANETGDPDDPTGYAIPGGMTLKPDSELKSHFVPWYHVVAADVGAMYPTILKARNLTADTVVPARAGETPDDWVWLFELDSQFANSGRYVVKKADPADPFTKGKGWLIGVRHNPEAGMVNLAMTGILGTIQKVKSARARAKRENRPPDEVRIHDMTYASLKAARNAGTHGILVAVNVSCRQFNVWGGANITTIGQRILHETLVDWERQGIRVVYGDTDGIYMGCSKSSGNLPHFAEALHADVEPEADKWITLPNVALAAVAAANTKWRSELDYEGFELEAETHDAMVFVVHKNYLIFDAHGGGRVAMETKGNNFKGSDKAPMAQTLLRDIMERALRDVASWETEEKAREAMKVAIKKATRDVMATVEVAKTRREDITLKQSVSPAKSYEPNPDGTLRSQAVRTVALEDLLGEPITSTRKFRFIVCREPLPLYKDLARQERRRAEMARSGHILQVKEPKNRGLKPIEYMWPESHVQPHMIDWAWYKSMVEDYVKGAFGFDSLELAVQRDLSSWF